MPSKTFVFNNSGTYTPTAGITSVIVECYGGGGGGGGAVASNAGGGAGGGGSGGYSRSVLLASQLGASQVVTIGAGGTGTIAGSAGATNGASTMFGTFVIALGGGAGTDFNPTGQALWGDGGNGAAIGTGDFVMPGQPGDDGSVLGVSGTTVNYAVLGGTGGALLGGGGQCNAPVAVGQNSVGDAAAPNTGAGGGGGAAYASASGQQANGGNGGSGVCIVTEYQPS